MQRFISGTFLAILILVGAVLLPTATAAAQTDPCTSPNHIYWLPQAGNDDNNGTSRGAPVLTMDKATKLAATGGGCIYLVSGAEDIFVIQVKADVSSTGIPLAPVLVYGLLLLVTAVLIAGGMWARRQSMRLQPRVIS